MTASYWLESFEDLLSHITSTWDGMVVLTGNMNFDLICRTDSLVTSYSNTLDMFGLKQIVTKPTKVTRTSRTLIDHINTNYPMRISATYVIPTSIVSDHDAPFACINVRVNRYQLRYKYIRNMKTFDEQEFITDLDTLTLNIVYPSDDPKEQLEYFNSMFKECLEKYAPLRSVRVRRPPAPWMDDSQIRSLQQLRNKFRKEAHQTGAQESWELFRDVRNKLKAAIRRARETFTRQALSSNNPKEVWRIIHRILKPNQQPLRQDPDKLNSFFACTAERTLPVSSDLPFCLEELIESIPVMKAALISSSEKCRTVRSCLC